MWHRTGEREEEERRPRTELYNISWQETSFVPAGDNPPARIVFWKNEPEISEEEIEACIDEVERRSGMAEVDTLAQRKIEEEPERFGKIADPHARLAAARSEVRAETPDLQGQESALAAREKPAAVYEPVMKGADILAEHAREAEKLLTDPRVMEVPEHQRMAKARRLAWEQRDLRDRYQRALLS